MEPPSGGTPAAPTAEAREEAQSDLPAATDELSERRVEVADEARRVQALIAQACSGVSAAHLETCPLEAQRVDSFRNVERGIAVRMSEGAGNESAVKREVECYRAKVETRAVAIRVSGVPSSARGMTTTGTPIPAGTEPPAAAPQAVAGNCLLDLEGLDVRVDEVGGRVDVHLSTDNDAHVTELRRRAQLVMAERRLSAR